MSLDKMFFKDTAILKLLLPWYELSRSSKVKGHEGKSKFTYDFLSVDNSNYIARNHRFEDTAICKYCILDMTFQGHSRSKVIGEMKVPIRLPICS